MCKEGRAPHLHTAANTRKEDARKPSCTAPGTGTDACAGPVHCTLNAAASTASSAERRCSTLSAALSLAPQRQLQCKGLRLQRGVLREQARSVSALSQRPVCVRGSVAAHM